MTARQLFDCPACGTLQPYELASSRYTHAPICNACARREAFEGPFWPEAARTWRALTEEPRP